MNDSTRQSDFYILASDDPAAREAFLYKLLERVQKLGHRIYIKVASEAAARALDNRLWDYRADAFLPHDLAANNDPSSTCPTPIEIGYGDALPKHRDVYVNLAFEIDERALEFNRTIEIVVQDDDVLHATRANFSKYKQAGYKMQTNDMRRKA